ncbi:hypothetical protein IWQ56_002952 [Coemansia nantahalensis]|nr:hypothetical protein IWQ56_002952 [Coemansia nantahalensis]
MGGTDWFTYFLHPERLPADFGPQCADGRWESPEAQHAAAIQVLQGLLSANNFRDYVLSAYPAIGDQPGRSTERYTGPTPPSTPRSPAGGAAAAAADDRPMQRIGQCARFGMAPETGLPAEPLAAVLRASGLPGLSARQARLLAVASALTGLVGFEVEDVEGAVHATIRFIYYLHMLESGDVGGSASERQFQYRRWTVRAAYREEEAGLSLEVEGGPAMEANCQHLAEYAETLDGADERGRQTRFKVAYDVARVLLAQAKYERALAQFLECQRIDRDRCRADKFGLAWSRPRPSVDEYVAACTTIVQTLAPSAERTATPTGQLDAMHISTQPDARIGPLLESRDYAEAARLCFLAALDHPSAGAGGPAEDFAWMQCIHPQLLAHCARQSPATAAGVARALSDAAAQWISSRGGPRMLSATELEEMERHSAAIALFIAGDAPGAQLVVPPAPDSAEPDGGACGTVAENMVLARDSLSLDTSKYAIATLQMAYCYLAGLRLLEKEQYQAARVWFGRGADPDSGRPSEEEQPQDPLATALAAQHAEKDKGVRAALESQLCVYRRLADIYCQLEQGASIDDVEEDIGAVVDMQVPVRFEFLERIVAASLRQGNGAVFTRLVGTIAANQKLYQQLPEIQLALLQVASLLVVVRDVLEGAGIEVARELAEGGLADSDMDALSAEDMERLQASVAEVVALFLKIPVGGGGGGGRGIDLRAVMGPAAQPGSKHENEVERFCRMWGDPAYLALLGALLAEAIQAGSGESATGPAGLCALAARIVCTRPDAGADGHATADGASGQSIAGALISPATEQGRKNAQHLQDTALIVLASAARALPGEACVWLSLSAVATGERLEELFMAPFVEFLCLRTDAFSPAALDASVGQPWFQRRLPAMIRSLVALRMSGAAAVLHQCAAEISYGAAIPMVAQAFERREIDQAVAAFFWDPDIIEYAQYLNCLPANHPIRMDFAVPSAELAASRTLILSAFFQWLAAALCQVQVVSSPL